MTDEPAPVTIRRTIYDFEKRLHGLEIQIARICSHIESEQGIWHRAITEIHMSLKEISHTLNGNGNPGMRTRLDRLEQIEKRRTWYFTGVWGAICGLAATLATYIFKGNQ